VRVAVLADVHGNPPALKAVLDAIRGQVDRVLFLGDLFGYYPFVNECVEMAAGILDKGVLGNHDQVLLTCLAARSEPPAEYTARYGGALSRSLRELSPAAAALAQSWPKQRSIQVGDDSLLLCHGAPWDVLEGRVYPDFRQWERFDDCAEGIVLMGHTHYPMLKSWNGKLIVNPGSVGQARDRSGEACYAILQLPERTATLHRAPYDASRMINDARAHEPKLPYLWEVLTR